jgi:hypothetical protein
MIMSSSLDPLFAGLNLAQVNGFVKMIKICCTASFGREVKPGLK